VCANRIFSASWKARDGRESYSRELNIRRGVGNLSFPPEEGGRERERGGLFRVNSDFVAAGLIAKRQGDEPENRPSDDAAALSEMCS
jgi:hypothetical protein